MMSSLSIALTSGKSGDTIGPGLDDGPDGVVLVGRDRYLLAGERHHEDLAVRGVAPEGRGERVAIRVMGRGPPVRRDVCRVGEDRVDAGLVAGDRAVSSPSHCRSSLRPHPGTRIWLCNSPLTSRWAGD